MEEQIYNFFNSMPSFALILFIGVFLYTLGKGADILVEEAVCLSIRWNIPKAIIGATIISIGTTLPEAAVSVMAAISGNPDLALGNAIGSIIADTGLIIGVSALIGKLPVTEKISEFQGRIQFFLTIALVIICRPRTWGNTGLVPQYIGFIFLSLLLLYIYLSLKNKAMKEELEELEEDMVEEITEDMMETRTEDNTDNTAENILEDNPPSILLQLFKLIAGIAIIILSSKLLIPSVEITAIRIGIPQGIIAATLIAFGTSLPELVTAITAVKKGHGELAVGNIVGADILNILFVIGASATATKQGLIVPTSFHIVQLPMMLLIVLMFRLFSKKPTNTISKKQGMVLLFLYTLYIGLNFIFL